MALPEGWKTLPLTDVAEVRLGRQRSPSRATGPNMRPYLRAANVGWGHLRLEDVKEMDFTPKEFETYRLRPNDILLNEASGSPAEVGKPVVYQGEVENACFQNTILRVRAIQSKAHVPYLYYHLLRDAREQRFADSSRGTNIQHIGRARLASWPTTLPPLGEQRKIAAILSSVDEAIERTQAVIDQVQVVKKGLMQQLLTRGLPGRHTRFKQTEIGEIPAEWEMVSVGDVGEVRNGTTPRKSEDRFWKGGQIPWLPTGKVNDRLIEKADQFVTTAGLAETSLRIFPAGSVLVAMIGQGKTRGKAALLCFAGTINQNFAGIAPATDRVSSKFLFLFLEHEYSRLRNSGRGSNQDALNCKIVRDYLIPLPPIQEQRTIESLIWSHEERLGQEHNSLSALQDLKQALMSVLLTGELRVTPDPEPTP